MFCVKKFDLSVSNRLQILRLFNRKFSMLHQSEIQLPTNRKFGFFFTIVFMLGGGYFFNFYSSSVAYPFFGMALSFLLITIINADLLLTLNKLWMNLGLLLGMIMSPIVLGIIFFSLFMPTSIVMRLCGRDELSLAFKRKPTNWIVRKPSTETVNSFNHQF